VAQRGGWGGGQEGAVGGGLAGVGEGRQVVHSGSRREGGHLAQERRLGPPRGGIGSTV